MVIRQISVSSSDTAETVISARPCFVFGIRPRVTSTAGTVTVRNDSAANGAAGAIKRVCPIGTLQAGVSLDGAFFDKGLTVQLSNGADVTDVIWETGP